MDLDCSYLFPAIPIVYWTSMIGAAFAAVVVPEIRKWHRYGKLRESLNQKETTRDSSSSWLDTWTVPKRWFIYFYVLGFVWTAMLLLTKGEVVRFPLEWTLCKEETIVGFKGEFPSLPMYVYLVHLFRRLIEESISPPSNAQMHVAGFLVGASFYGFVPLALASSSIEKPDTDIVLLIVGLSVFIWGNWHQLKCHQILRDLRRQGTGYGFPRGDWFAVSSSPHYLAEIIIYISLAIICKSVGTLPVDLVLGVCFTIINLCITGGRTHEWYLQRYGEEYAREGRWKVIPLVY